MWKPQYLVAECESPGEKPAAAPPYPQYTLLQIEKLLESIVVACKGETRWYVTLWQDSRTQRSIDFLTEVAFLQQGYFALFSC